MNEEQARDRKSNGNISGVHMDGRDWRQDHGNLGHSGKDRRKEQEDLGPMTAAYCWNLTKMDKGNT